MNFKHKILVFIYTSCSRDFSILQTFFLRILGASCDGEWTLEEEIDDTNDVAMETLEENEG